ncbi:amidohydrolase 2 [Thermosinus carboxydivorans Nor1]|uniref:Amidohydrolase 2 n=1 Tax=Thermosinus carboxydivorans Nor1 TaxID=401526 RepID=A1HM49_9FIRM|nr:amidohydrolase family protein [Thermosinus carboxydivorans]EAX48900.1 amidohydrolase 2 [Thermosinus carboxydivorans Nor1]
MYFRLRTTINTIQLIDNHGHPGFAEFFEALPHEQRIPFAVDTFKTPEESAAGFPYLRDLHYEAYEKFYGFTKSDIQDATKREELARRYDLARRSPGQLVDKIMKAAGVELLLANIALPDSLKGKDNIRFVPSLDPLIFPFDNTPWKRRQLSKYFIGFFEYMLSDLKIKHGYTEEGFDGYLRFIDRVMDSYVQERVVAFKFVIAYARNTYFAKIDISQGPELYAKARRGDAAAYGKLQDLLVWYILRRIRQFDMAVQFHFAVTDNYVNYFDPLNLANILEDEELKDLKLVILHGGYPRFGQAEVLALGGLTPNKVYIDISGRIMFANHPKIIAKMLRTWLEKPVLWDKILYGSDVLWGERYIYTCAKTARDSVYYALAGMIDDDIIDEDTAIAIARKILRENAIRLYNLAPGPTLL